MGLFRLPGRAVPEKPARHQGKIEIGTSQSKRRFHGRTGLNSTPYRPRWSGLAGSAAFLTALALTACGTFTLDNPSTTRSIKRRVYVNDKAVNDSLKSDLVRRGVKFVLQPGRTYDFSLDST